MKNLWTNDRFDSICILEKSYKNYDEYTKAVGNMVLELLKNEYIVIVKQEMPDFTIIQFQHDDSNSEDAYGVAQPYWLYEEEVEQIYDEEEEDIEYGN